MEITTANPSHYFSLFYILAFAFLALAVIYLGRKKGYSLEKLLLLLGTVSLGTILGSRLVTIPLNEWGNLLFTDEVFHLNRAASGGIILGLLCLYIAYRVMKFSPRFLIHFAWLIPLALSIQKIGCFINGCCYGVPTNAAWGVVYPPYSQPHHSHWLQHHIEASSPWSLSIHPVQLYEILSMILIAILVWTTRHLWRKNWSVILFAIFLIFSARIVTDFYRDGAGSQFGTEVWNGMRYIQWAFIFIAIILGILLYLNEKGLVGLRRNARFLPIKWWFKELELAVCLSLITLAFKGVFSSFEWMALWFTLIPAIVLFVWRQIHEHSFGAQRWWALSAFLIPVWVIAQTVETVVYNDSLAVKTESFHRFDVGVNSGRFYNLLLSDPNYTENTGCSGGTSISYTETLVESEYSAWGAGYSKVKRKGFKETTWGVNGYLGSIESSLIDTIGTFSQNMWGINPYIKYEDKWYGVGVGFHAGQLYRNKEEKPKVEDFDEFVESKPILPEVYLRLGVRKYLDVDYNYGFLFPSPFPTTYHRASVGTGLWQDYDYNIRFGKFFPVGDEFISAEGIITKNIGLKLMYIFKDDYDFELPENSSGKFVMSLNYRFGHQ